MLFLIHENGAVAHPAMKGEIIHSQHARSRCACGDVPSYQTQQRIRTGCGLHLGETSSDMGSSCTAQRIAQQGQGLSQLDRSAGIRLHHTR